MAILLEPKLEGRKWLEKDYKDFLAKKRRKDIVDSAFDVDTLPELIGRECALVGASDSAPMGADESASIGANGFTPVGVKTAGTVPAEKHPQDATGTGGHVTQKNKRRQDLESPSPSGKRIKMEPIEDEGHWLTATEDKKDDIRFPRPRKPDNV